MTNIADRRADKTTQQCRTNTERKLTRLRQTKHKRRKTDDNWVRNISSRPLDETETQILSYGLKHSVTPKRIPTETIVSSVEAVLSRQRDLSEPVKDNIRSRIASTLQSASLPDNNLTNDERQALKRLKTDKDIVILPADSTNTWRPQTSVFWREITVHQYSTTTSSRLHRDSHYDLYCQTTTTYRRHHGPT